MRRFRLVRSKDPTGVSGVGDVAEGVEFWDGSAALRWYHPDYPATAVWPSIEGILAVHGHGGLTVVEYVDEEDG